MSSYNSITIRAGKKAYQVLKNEGLKPDRITVMAGASGGPKWLVLSGIDRIIPELFKNRTKSLFLLGSSIGAWRMAAFASQDPSSSIEKFEEAYIGQHYESRPTPVEVMTEFQRLLDSYITGEDIRHIIDHHYMRINILTVKSKGLGISDNKILLGANLAAAATANLISRKFLRYYFDRALFFHAKEIPPFYDMDQFDIVKTPLTVDNIRHSLLASGSIPLVVSGVRDIPGAPRGTYRDGGIIDYHLDIPFTHRDDGLVLYPHFFDRVVPGWFDKGLSWRKPRPGHMENVILVTPSWKFIEELPFGKVPDRNDFKKFYGRDHERVAYWKTVVRESKRLGDEFMEAVQSGKIRDIVQPF